MQYKNYSNLVFEHYRHPRNFGKLKKSTLTAEESNILCGDEIRVYLLVRNKKIADFKYQAQGCALSIASASILSEKIKGKNIQTVRCIKPENIDRLLGFKVTVVRKGCATLPLKALKKALEIPEVT